MAKLELKDITVADLPVGKPWYKSKTIWFNVVTVLASLFGALPALLPVVEPLISPAVFSVALFTIGVVNVVLRAVTKNGIVTKA